MKASKGKIIVRSRPHGFCMQDATTGKTLIVHDYPEVVRRIEGFSKLGYCVGSMQTVEQDQVRRAKHRPAPLNGTAA